jgi:iron-sulfur cluster insertion protein
MDTITLTDNAVKKIKELLTDNNVEPDFSLRIFVQGGGCSGFSYGFSFDGLQSDDLVINHDGVKVLVDPMSLQYLAGSTVDYKEELMGSQFVIRNPNVVSQCGCGSSFSV